MITKTGKKMFIKNSYFRKKWVPPLIIIITFIIYVSVFFEFYHEMGTGLISLSVIPVIITAATFGFRKGILVSLFCVCLNITLFYSEKGIILNVSFWNRAIPHYAIIILIGAVVGRLHDLDNLLRNSRDRLEQKVLERTETLNKLNEDLWVEIKERKKIEEALKESEEKWKSLVENTPNIIIQADSNGTILFMNNIEPNSEKLIGTNICDYVSLEEHQKLIKENIESVFKTGEPKNIEFEGLNNKGNKSWIVGRIGPIFKKDSITSLLITTTDITVRKKMEDSLRFNEELNKRIIEAIPGGVIYVAMDGEIITANKIAQKILGIDSDEIIKNYASDFETKAFTEDGNLFESFDYPVSKCLLENKEQVPVIMGLQKKDGGIFWLIFNVVPLADKKTGQQVGAVAAFVDISERKEMEEKLRQNEQRLRAFFDATFEGIVVSDQGIVLDVNQSCLTMFGLENVSEVKGRSVIEFVKPEEQEKIMKLIKSGSDVHYESIGKRKNGTFFPIEVRGKLIIYQGKTVRISALHDVSPYKNAEEQIMKSLKEKEVLLKEIHHRVKNNLQIISSLLFLQTKNIKDKNILDIFKDSQNRIKSMSYIHERLYQSKDFDKIDFPMYVRNLTSNLMSSYNVDLSNMNVTTEVENVLLDINTAIPCGLIINELVSNSIKYAFQENSEHNQIFIKLQAIDGKMILEVGDNGGGIPKEVNFGETESLGLQLVNILIQQIGGSVELDRTSGTKFTIIFDIEN